VPAARNAMMLSQQAFAKINLGLRILERLPDGYHAIETIYVELDWGDMLFAEPAEEIEIICHGNPVPQGEDNLVLKAARLLQQETNTLRGARITLEKSIPVGGGLGGGSSDAAATLKVLSKLWQIDIGTDGLVRLAKALGADIPFFLQGGTAYATGIGDRLQPVTWNFDGWIVVFNPGWEISTSWAYREWDLSGQPSSQPLPLTEFLTYKTGDPEFRRHFVNDFESIVFRKYPELQHHYHQLWETGADYVGLSGSGSSLYGLYSRHDRAATGLEWGQSQGWARLTQRQ
jgi:4-diphosphocytidyl-2-C-methyl-D-erythritol kinase